MFACKSSLGKAEFVVQDIKEGIVYFDRLLRERFDGRLHAGIHSRGIFSVHLFRPSKSIILRDVKVLGSIRYARVVYSTGTFSFVSVVEVNEDACNRDFVLNTNPKKNSPSPCVYCIFSSRGSLIVSAPASNILSTSASTPWFFRLDDQTQVRRQPSQSRSCTYYQKPSLVAASQSLSISSESPCLISW